MVKEHLLNGEIIIMPSDTVWGIFGVINKENQKEINKIKQAPEEKVISVMFANVEQAKNYVSEEHHELLKELGEAKTFILNSSELTKELLGYETLGVRIVPEFAELISETGPLFTTSANIHGEETPEEFEEIKKLFADKVSFIKEGKQKQAKASTITSYIKDSKGEVIR